MRRKSSSIAAVCVAVLVSLSLLTQAQSMGGQSKYKDLLKFPKQLDMEEFLLGKGAFKRTFGVDKQGNVSVKNQWLKSANVANFFGMEKTSTIPLPVSVNLVFVGFGGDGEQGIRFTEAELRPWFESLEHHLEQNYVSHENSKWRKYHDDRAIPPTRIQHTYHFNVIELSPMIHDVVEALIHTYMRPVNPDETLRTARAFQIDVERFSVVIESLLHDLMISDFYTVLILNPKRYLPADAVYGYRAGFSNEEIDRLRTEEDYISREEVTRKEGARWELYEGEQITSPRITQKREDGENIDFVTLHEESEIWAKNFLDQHKLILERAQLSGEKGSPFILLEHENAADEAVHRISVPRVATYQELAREYASSGTVYQKEYLRAIQTNEHVTENCLVDTWVSHNRWAFVDLSAGPFSWGPRTGGVGIRTEESIPRVTEELLWVDKRPEIDAAFAEKVKELPEGLPNLDGVQDLDTFLEYFAIFCNMYTADEQPTWCLNLLAQSRELVGRTIDPSIEQMIVNGAKADPVVVLISQVSARAQLKARPLDAFLSDLGAVIDSSLHTLVTPVTTARPTLYRTRTAFHLYVIDNHNSFSQDETTFDFDTFEREISRLRLPLQEFTFSRQFVRLQQDGALAMAYTTSLRTTRVLELTEDGSFHSADRVYLDSAVLQEQLQVIGDDLREYDLKQTHSVHHVPIFLFSLEFDWPVYIDVHHTAKALDDMIVIVQSDFKHFRTPMGCNGKTVYTNLRNPLPAALSATARFLGGLVNTHLTYSTALKAPAQNWLWSVGDNPLCFTASGANTHFSRFNIDAVSRNYITSALSSSSDILNDAVVVLESLSTTSTNFAVVRAGYFKNMTNLYDDIKTTWKNIYDGCDTMSYSIATQHLTDLVRKSRDFEDMAKEAVGHMEMFRCEEPPADPNQWMIYVAFACDFVLVIIYLTFRSNSSHLKLN